jgi:hypothetical protein
VRARHGADPSIGRGGGGRRCALRDGPRKVHSSHLARLRPRGLGSAIALYTWALRGGDLGAHPRCSDSPPRSKRKGRSRGPCIYLAYGRSTCAELASRVDTKASHDDTAEWKESRCVVPSSAPAAPENPGRCGSDCWYPVAQHFPRACPGVPADDAAARSAPLRPCPPSASPEFRDEPQKRPGPAMRGPARWSGATAK